jgi:hypothetical protein
MMSSGTRERSQKFSSCGKARIAMLARFNFAKHNAQVVAFGNFSRRHIAPAQDWTCRIAHDCDNIGRWDSRQLEAQ